MAHVPFSRPRGAFFILKMVISSDTIAVRKSQIRIKLRAHRKFGKKVASFSWH